MAKEHLINKKQILCQDTPSSTNAGAKIVLLTGFNVHSKLSSSRARLGRHIFCNCYFDNDHNNYIRILQRPFSFTYSQFGHDCAMNELFITRVKLFANKLYHHHPVDIHCLQILLKNAMTYDLKLFHPSSSHSDLVCSVPGEWCLQFSSSLWPWVDSVSTHLQ